jgi:hypothetical protein
VRRAESSEPTQPASGGAGFKDVLLAEIRKSKVVFYNTVVAQALEVAATQDSVTFTFSPTQRALLAAFEQNRAWMEALATKAAGRRVTVLGQRDEAATAPAAVATDSNGNASDRKTALKKEALADEGVQALLDVFPAEIRDVEEV